MDTARTAAKTRISLRRGLAGLGALLVLATASFGVASQLEQKVVPVRPAATVAAPSAAQERFRALKERQLEQRERAFERQLTVPAAAANERYRALKERQAEQRLDAVTVAPSTTPAVSERFRQLKERQAEQRSGNE